VATAFALPSAYWVMVWRLRMSSGFVDSAAALISAWQGPGCERAHWIWLKLPHRQWFIPYVAVWQLEFLTHVISSPHSTALLVPERGPIVAVSVAR
jgi:hypothetical protein